jgi:hypothetical protein
MQCGSCRSSQQRTLSIGNEHGQPPFTLPRATVPPSMTGAKHKSGKLEKGWKQVDLDDSFLFGLDEPGFQSLETIDAADVIDLAPELQTIIARADAETLPLKCVSNCFEPSLRTRRLHALQFGAVAGTPVTGFRLCIMSASVPRRAKSAKLKRKKGKAKSASHAAKAKGEVATLNEDVCEQLAEGPVGGKASGKEASGKEASSKAASVRAARSCRQDAEEATGASTPVEADEEPLPEAWDDYGLAPEVTRSLVSNGFTSPTPIQHECLPAAILGNADIIGAAQTVRAYVSDGARLKRCVPVSQTVRAADCGVTAGANRSMSRVP